MTNTILTFVVGALALLSVIFALQTIFRTRELNSLSRQAAAINNLSMRVQATFGESVEYSKTHPDLARVLQPFEAKPAAH